MSYTHQSPQDDRLGAIRELAAEKLAEAQRLRNLTDELATTKRLLALAVSALGGELRIKPSQYNSVLRDPGTFTRWDDHATGDMVLAWSEADGDERG